MTKSDTANTFTGKTNYRISVPRRKLIIEQIYNDNLVS